MALRAGSVGPGCEVGLGPSRGWGSGRPASPPRRLPPESASRGAPPFPSPRPPFPQPSAPRKPSGERGRLAAGSGGSGAGALGGAPLRGAPDGGPGARRASGACGGDSGRAPGPSRGSPRLWSAPGPPSLFPSSFPLSPAVSAPRGTGGGAGGRGWDEGGGLPGAAPRPAPSSRLRTGADKGNPTV